MANQKLDLEEAKRLIKQSRIPGFRKANKSILREAEALVRDDFKGRGQAFIDEYKELCKKYGIEIKAELQPVDGAERNIAKAGLMLDEYVEKTKPQTKKWSIAATENLELRKVCEHIEHAEGNICEKCGLALVNWGTENKGVTDEYEVKMIEKIAGWQKEEMAENTAESTDK